MTLISIIVAVKNAEKTLQRCIDSVSHQTHEKTELIIIDGKSTDSTVEIIKKNERHIAHWISENDSGVYQAWNKGLKHATGEWVCFLGGDDYFWEKDCLEKICAYLDRSYPDTRIVYGRVNVVNEKGDILYSIGEPWHKIKKRFLQISCLPHPGLMHHKGVFEEHGHFNDTFIIAGDYELLLRELLHFNAKHAPITMVGMQEGGLSTIAKNAKTGLLEMRRALQMHGIVFPGLYWLMGLIKTYLKIAAAKVKRLGNSSFGAT